MVQVEYEFEFNADPALVSTARHGVGEAAERLGCESVDDVQLAASELIANAVEHGRGPVTVRASHDGVRLRVAVHDRGGGRPIVGADHGLGERGRGMQIVAAVAASWGCDVVGGGKTVWAEFPGSAEPSTRLGRMA